jgi:hypothetical protein
MIFILLEHEEGREGSLPSQFTRLGAENYPIKGSSDFSGSNMHGPLGDPGDDDRNDQHAGGKDEGPG